MLPMWHCSARLNLRLAKGETNLDEEPNSAHYIRTEYYSITPPRPEPSFGFIAENDIQMCPLLGRVEGFQTAGLDLVCGNLVDESGMVYFGTYWVTYIRPTTYCQFDNLPLNLQKLFTQEGESLLLGLEYGYGVPIIPGRCILVDSDGRQLPESVFTEV